MLSLLLGVLVTLLGLALYLTAVLLPALGRSVDLFVSGLLMFYGLVLWFCAERFTGALLLGQLAVIALFTALEAQVLRSRWGALSPEQQIEIRQGRTLQQQWLAIRQLRPVPSMSTAPGTAAAGETKIKATAAAQPWWGSLLQWRDRLQGRKDHGKRWVRAEEPERSPDTPSEVSAIPSKEPVAALVYQPRPSAVGEEYLETLEAAIAQFPQLRSRPQDIPPAPAVALQTEIAPSSLDDTLVSKSLESAATPTNEPIPAEHPPISQAEAMTSKASSSEQPAPEVQETAELIDHSLVATDLPEAADAQLNESSGESESSLPNPLSPEAADVSLPAGERWAQFWASTEAVARQPRDNSRAIAPSGEQELLDQAGSETDALVQQSGERDQSYPDNLAELEERYELAPPSEQWVAEPARDLVVIARLTDLIEPTWPGAIAQGALAEPIPPGILTKTITDPEAAPTVEPGTTTPSLEAAERPHG
jgi:hypothetical protein